MLKQVANRIKLDVGLAGIAASFVKLKEGGFGDASFGTCRIETNFLTTVNR